MALVFNESNNFKFVHYMPVHVISQATATSDIVSMCMDFDNDQPGDNCIS